MAVAFDHLARAAHRNPTILVVDDAPLLRELACDFLAGTGTILTAKDGNEALAQLREHSVDLVITDVTMPDMDGEELCRRLRREPETEHLPVIAMISDDAHDDHARAIRAGASEVMAKPLSRPLLVHTVHRYVHYQPARAQPRVVLDALANFSDGDHTAMGWLRNLSRGGAFIENRDIGELGDIDENGEHQLSFSLPGSEESITPTAQIVWQDGGSAQEAKGFGLRFIGLDPEALRSIDTFIHEHQRRS